MPTKPIIEEHELRGGEYRSAVIWQEVPDGMPEQALQVRSYDGGENANLVEIKQGDDCVLINGETIAELCKLMRRFVS